MTDAVDRFWAFATKTDGCWIWGGSVNHSGYGTFKAAGRTVRAHRFSWEIHNGPIAVGLLVCHRCDNPPCVRPDHLFLGTYLDNRRDCIAKGRARSGVLPCGEQHKRAKLTALEVIAIRQRYAAGELQFCSGRCLRGFRPHYFCHRYQTPVEAFAKEVISSSHREGEDMKEESKTEGAPDGARSP